LGSAFSLVDKNSGDPHLVFSPSSVTKIDAIEIIRNNIKLFDKTCDTLQEAVKVRDDYLNNNKDASE
jgi:hypothetical protein